MTDVLYPSSNPDTSALCAILAILEVEAAPNNAVPTVSTSSLPGTGPSSDTTASAQTFPLVECARRRVLGIQAGLDILASNVAAAMLQLESNRDAALEVIAACGFVDRAEVLAVLTTGINAVNKAASNKRIGLEIELVAADAVLGEAIDATSALVDVMRSQSVQLQHAVTFTDIDLLRHVSALIRVYTVSQAAASAIPERPVTSSFLAVEPASVLDAPCHVKCHEFLSSLATVWEIEPPTSLTCLQAAQLQAWLPPGGSLHPCSWNEVYRATTHSFDAAAFHARCDGRSRLLVLVRAKEGDWLFGGFTAVGFSPPDGFHSDPAAFLFSLTNSLGRPEKLESKRTGTEIWYCFLHSASFGYADGLHVIDKADAEVYSIAATGVAYAASASTGPHPMSNGTQCGWTAAEVVAWVV